ncbi:MAG: transcription-repair coupling factor [Myxococcales bacterium]|nr:transcription-repair coupling factor [Myxococcota bacterium]MDW8282513.1 transcription-repair coupling factor [Myxococcales bacterium]
MSALVHGLLTHSVNGLHALSARQGLDRLLALRAGGARRVRLQDCEGAMAALTIARLAADRGSGRSPLLVVIVKDEAEAQRLVRDVRFFVGGERGDDPAAAPPVMHLPVPEQSPWADVTPDRRTIGQRLAVLFRLTQARDPTLCGSVLIASVNSLCRRVMPREALIALCDILQAEQEVDRERTLSLLTRAGYTRMPVCEDPGTFAVRGGVIDLFPPLYRFPVRLELYGDLIESMRFYDPQTQRTLRKTSEICIHPVREALLSPGHALRERLLQAGDLASHPSSRTRQILEQIEAGEDFFGIEALVPAMHARMDSVFSYLPPGTSLFVLEPHQVMDALLDHLVDAERAYERRLAEHQLCLPPADFYLNCDQLEAELRAPDRSCIEAQGLEIYDGSAVSDAQGAGGPEQEPAPMLRFACDNHRSLQAELVRGRADHKEHFLQPLVDRMRRQLDEGQHVVVVCSSLQHGERLGSLLRGYGLPTHLHRPGLASLAADEGPGRLDLLELGPPSGRIELLIGSLGRGLDLPLDGISLYSEAEIFGEKARRVARTPPRPAPSLSSFKDLREGSFVVHKLHGIGVYRGLAKLPVRGVPVDFVHIQYEGGSLYLPVWRLREVQRYVGAEGLTPRIDRLGGETWQKTRARVGREIRQLAEELLRLYAQRQAQPGHAVRLDEAAEQMLHEFEATFPFEETPDQQRAIDEVLADLEDERPMDRLVCGDVGYGKTEVAMRAAMKVVLGGRQVAVLAPTTVLVEQHLQTFRSRFSAMPVRIDSLSRFRSRAEQLQTIRALAEGSVDIVIGTHRLLSPDVRFRNLGLVIIDEEQRFGVAHKERLRRMRTQVDTLTLSATPIPRTLHMALSGLREISLITTPPADRLAIRTLVAREGDDLIREGVRRELQRGGQVFFVHNRVETIGKWARRLHELLPEVRILTAHGQMAAEELERVMLDFVQGRADLLLCTTIIESGLDIPRANTMFVDRADTFGLSQLYQLRGRIGRSRERAYCYLLVPPEREMTSEAKQRLAVLQRFSELGAGYNIATHDLEIRGAGELLGDRQSGTMSAVGFDMYIQMLNDAVAELRGQPIRSEPDLDLSCDLPGFIPEAYLPDTGQRLDFYQRLSQADDEEQVAELLGELRDRYGPLPEEVEVLAGITVVRSLGRRLGATALELSEARLALALGERTVLRPEQAMKLVSARRSPWKLTPDMRLVRTWQSDQERRDRLQLARSILAELLAQATAGSTPAPPGGSAPP